MIRVRGLTQHYGIRPVLKDLDFEVESGELVAVMGPNGMGKSTLLAAIGGMLSPQGGTIEIDGLARRSSEEAELAIRRRVVYLPADMWLPAGVSGREFLLAVGRMYDVEYDRLFDHIDRLLQLFDLGEKADAPISSYSTGQSKKIALAAALVSDAPVMLLDEPFSGGLDPSGIVAMKQVLRRLAENRDRTVVIAVPVPELVEEVADRIAILRHGAIVAFDTPDGLRRLAGGEGSPQDVLEQLVNPRTMENVAHYFDGEGERK